MAGSSSKRIGARNQRVGKAGEQVAEIMLRQAGVRMVEQIATPYVIYASRGTGRNRWVQMRHTAKVSGDRRGIMPDGRRVLCEVKVRSGNLRKSDFEPHQLAALEENSQLNGVSLVAWIHPDESLLLRWPLPGFEKARASVTLEVARGLRWDGRT